MYVSIITEHIHKLCAHYLPFFSSFPFFIFMIFIHIKILKCYEGAEWIQLANDRVGTCVHCNKS